jgi:hypothetical protein
MNRKLPDDLFERYVALGPTRTYAALAEPFGATRRAVAKRAAKEGWSERLQQIESQAREKSDAMIVDAISEMRSRHLKTLRAVNARVLSALQQFPLNSGMEAIRGAEIAIKLERLVAGEASEHAQVDVAAVTREEMRRLLTTTPVGAGGDDDW